MSYLPNSFVHQPTNEFVFFAPSSLHINNNLDSVSNTPFMYEPLSNMCMYPSIDWKETAVAHVFKVDVPGLTKEEVKVEVEDRTLKISGGRDKEIMQIGETSHHTERKSGKFLKTFKLTQDANTDQVKATMSNGVLTVTVPKDVNKPLVKIVEISD